MTTNRKSIPFTAKTPTSEPVEIRIADGRNALPLVVTAFVCETGTVVTLMSRGGCGADESIRNLQITKPIPTKPVAGWQAELVEAIGSGLYPLAEVR